MKVTTYGGQTIHLPAGQVLVESEALESLKAMAQRLQKERDELLEALEDARNYIEATTLNASSPKTRKNYNGCLVRIESIIAKCTAKPDVLA